MTLYIISWRVLISLKRAGDTRWGSHYVTLINLFSSLFEVLDIIIDDGSSEQKGEAKYLSEVMHSFDYVFSLHLMKTILYIEDQEYELYKNWCLLFHIRITCNG